MKVSRKALLVDDDIDALNELGEAVESAGLEVVCCSNGTQAFETLNMIPDISVLITDIMMPNLSGLDLIEKIIRVIGSKRQLFIGIISGVASKDDLARAINLPVSFYINKPVNYKELYDACCFLRVESLDQLNIKYKSQLIDTNYYSRDNANDFLIKINNIKKRINYNNNLINKYEIDDSKFRILLEMYCGYILNQPIPISSVCGFDGIPYTTGLRKITELERSGLIIRKKLSESPRRINVDLTQYGINTIITILETMK